MNEATTSSTAPVHEPNLLWAMRQIEASLRGLRFGALTLIVQDGVIVQVERTERHRYRRPEGSEPA
jgi:hypothetical protein